MKRMLRTPARATQAITGLAVVAIAVAALSAARPLGHDGGVSSPTGLRYDIHMSNTSTSTTGQSGSQSKSSNGPPSPTSPASFDMIGHAQVASGNARIDLAKVGGYGGGMFSDGDIMIVRDSGHTLIVATPSKKEYYQTDLVSMLQGLNSLMSGLGAIVKIQADNVKIDVQPQGVGEQMSGYSTAKYELTQDFGTTVSMMGFMHMHSTTHSVTDYWFAPDLKDIINPFVPTAKQMTQSLAFLGPEFATQMQAAQAKLYDGVALKMIQTSQTTDDKGKANSATMIMETANVVRGAVPASAFDVPSGYTKVQPKGPLAMVQALAGNTDTSAKQNTGASGKSGGKSVGSTVANSAGEAAASGAQGAIDQAAHDAAAKAVHKAIHFP
jgi:hypothetical protein